MESRLVSLGGRRVRVTQPNVLQYGHLGLELQMTYALAKAEGADVYLRRPRRVVSEALLALEPEGVRRLSPGMAGRAWLGLRWWMAGLPSLHERADRAGRVLRQVLDEEAQRYTRNTAVAPQVRRQLGLVRQHARERNQAAELAEIAAAAPYYRRRLVRSRVPVRLGGPALERALAGAARAGIDLDRPLVTLHVREAGFKRGREMHERKLGARDDSARNARVETYFDAVDYLVSAGHTVVRVGDPTMTPVQRPGVVDLATLADRDPMLEVLCLLRSRFLICGEAGPAAVAYLTNTPSLTVNATDLISSYPVREDMLLVPKRVFVRATGRRLSLLDMLEAEYLGNMRNTTTYRYEDNTPDEILSAVREMLEGLAGGWRETPAQAALRTRIQSAAERARHQFQYVRKWGADDGFLGDGRVVERLARAEALSAA